MEPTPYQLGEAQGLLFKAAGDSTVSYSLKGTLYFTPKGWGLLSVPNALVRGAFDALHEPGAELPYNSEGRLNAHVSVFRPEETEQIGGPDVVTERGHQLTYTLGPLREIIPDWEGMSRVWAISIRSPEIERIRRSYGLSSLPNNDKYDLHLTVARRRVNVFKDNEVVKQSDNRVGSTCPHCGSTNTHGARAMEKHSDGRWCFANAVCGDCVNGFSVDENGSTSSLDTNPERDRSKRAELTPLNSLLALKSQSDRGNYAAKHQALLRMIRQSPGSFAVDQPNRFHPGLTHLPTGFRVHAPQSLASLVTGKMAKEDRPVPDDWNDPADREDCPSCGAMHERGDGYCNSCSARWPAKTK